MSGKVPENALFVCFGCLPNMGIFTESAAGGSERDGIVAIARSGIKADSSGACREEVQAILPRLVIEAEGTASNAQLGMIVRRKKNADRGL